MRAIKLGFIYKSLHNNNCLKVIRDHLSITEDNIVNAAACYSPCIRSDQESPLSQEIFFKYGLIALYTLYTLM